MAFFLKPRPRTWDLALDYHAAKQFEGNQRRPERSKVPIPDVFWAASSEMSIGAGDPPAPPSVSLAPPSPTSISWLFHVQPCLEILHLSPTSISGFRLLAPPSPTWPGDPPFPTSFSNLHLLAHSCPTWPGDPSSPTSISSLFHLQPHHSSPFLLEKPPVKGIFGGVRPLR